MTDKRLKYADQITLERIKVLHPAIRDKVREAYLNVNTHMLGKCVRLRLAYTTRSLEEQDALYAIGRTKLFDASGKRLGKVTNAKGGQSIHNYGLAWDIVLLLDTNGDGNFDTASWDTVADFDGDMVADWMEVVDAFKAIGAEWGGDWKFTDKPHFQMAFGMDWRAMQEKIHNGEFEIEEIDRIKYKWIKL
ncbi:M15 family metallopeptidase [Marinilongibacter aquaticus]|uniref:M15 family metallopeptidase n=1 Tax=Marinilongibacter aquaticus TaxID=2975157 RepID=UPI0021BDD717|nr:M15 family metallopeptidase [Marinilongibacter aquaticus]UBM58227.1 M15 family metallopeptidase [Marinilongibacter aquaticus]